MKKIQVFAAAALVAAMLSGCAQTETQSSVAPDAGAGMSKEIGGANGMLASDAIAPADRSVIKTGSLSFETAEIAACRPR